MSLKFRFQVVSFGTHNINICMNVSGIYECLGSCVTVYAYLFLLVAHLGHVTAIYICFVIPSKRKCDFVPQVKINP